MSTHQNQQLIWYDWLFRQYNYYYDHSHGKHRFVNWLVQASFATETLNITVDEEDSIWIENPKYEECPLHCPPRYLDKPDVEQQDDWDVTSYADLIMDEGSYPHVRRERRKMIDQLCFANRLRRRLQRLQVERQQEEAEEAKQEEDAAPIPHATQRTEEYITRFGRVSKPPNRF